MEGEITCQAGEIYKVHEKKKEKGIVKKTISRVITCTGVGIILQPKRRLKLKCNNLYRCGYNSPFGCADSGLCNDDSRCLVDYR